MERGSVVHSHTRLSAERAHYGPRVLCMQLVDRGGVLSVHTGCRYPSHTPFKHDKVAVATLSRGFHATAHISRATSVGPRNAAPPAENVASYMQARCQTCTG